MGRGGEEERIAEEEKGEECDMESMVHPRPLFNLCKGRVVASDD